MSATHRLFATLAGLALVVAGAAKASPTVEYSADWSMETAESSMTAKVFQAAGKERREMKIDGEDTVLIFRHDKKVLWTLMPADRMFMESSLSDRKGAGDDLANYDIQSTVVGPDTVNGVKTTKSKIIMTEKKPNGAKMGGFWWMTKDNILMKLDAISVEKGKKDRMKIELDNLKIGKQDPALFEIPAGYTKMSMPGIGGMLRGGEQGDPSGGDEERKSGKDKPRFGIKDAIKLIQ